MRFLSGLLNSISETRLGDSLSDPDRSHSLEQVEGVLRQLPTDRARLLAAFALLLGRVAHIDDRLSEDERRRMAEILETDLSLARNQADAVTELACERELCFTSDDHIVLRKIRELAPQSDRLNLVRALFHLASVDDISETESEEIRRIATALELTHRDYIALRSEFKEYLSILKGLPG